MRSDPAVDEWAGASPVAPQGAFAATQALVRTSLEGLAAQMEGEFCMARQAASPEGATASQPSWRRSRRRD